MIDTGKHRAGQLTKARILLKADASDAGEGWSDSEIAAALDISAATIARTRQQLVEEGVGSVLTRKHSPASARRRVFDGTAEAKLIALTRTQPPAGYARRTLRLLEEPVVELNIVERASDNTIGRMLKKTMSNRIRTGNGSFRRIAMPRSWPRWRTCRRCIAGRAIRIAPWSGWTRRRSNRSKKPACRSR